MKQEATNNFEEDIPLQKIRGSMYCKWSLLENNHKKLYENQVIIYKKLQEILQEIKEK